MEKIEKNGVSVELKRNYLTAGQITNLISEVIKPMFSKATYSM